MVKIKKFNEFIDSKNDLDDKSTIKSVSNIIDDETIKKAFLNVGYDLTKNLPKTTYLF